MAWIKEIDQQASKVLKEIYEKAENRTGEPTANVLKVQSLHPEVLRAHMELYETVMFKKGELSRMQREMIGVVVSKANECPYCVDHHSAALHHVTSDKERMESIVADYRKADLNRANHTICAYAEKLTKTPYKMVEEDVEALRRVGFSDRAIFEINQIVAYFNYVNRIVHGLGVESEA